MKRIEVNCQTGEIKEIELSSEEVDQAEANHAEWLASLPPETEE